MAMKGAKFTPCKGCPSPAACKKAGECMMKKIAGKVMLYGKKRKGKGGKKK